MARTDAEPLWLRRLSHPMNFAWACAWLMVLLVIGTVDQKFHGLHAAQEKYFSSWFLWVFDLLPLPGGRLALAVVFFCLLAFLFTRRATAKPGLLVTHVGAILMLLGGFLTDMRRQEGSMGIMEGEVGVMTQAERDLQLSIIDESPAEHDLVIAFRQRTLRPGRVFSSDRVAFSATMVALHRNSRRGDDGQLVALPEGPVPRENNPAIILRLSGTDIDGEHAIQMMGEPLRVSAGGRAYRLALEPVREILPFAIKLNDVIATKHPGTEIPASYRSKVTVIKRDGEPRDVVISMNKPLRLDGYTVYQSSYSDLPQGELSGFAVAYDPNPLFSLTYAYVSSIIMAIGLVVHLVTQVPGLLARRAEDQA